jgi:hypothetical protein
LSFVNRLREGIQHSQPPNQTHAPWSAYPGLQTSEPYLAQKSKHQTDLEELNARHAQARLAAARETLTSGREDVTLKKTKHARTWTSPSKTNPAPKLPPPHPPPNALANTPETVLPASLATVQMAAAGAIASAAGKPGFAGMPLFVGVGVIFMLGLCLVVVGCVQWIGTAADFLSFRE